MNPYILDTSVAIAWYFEEAFSESARRWQNRFYANRIRFVVPHFHRMEFGNVLRTNLKRKAVSQALAEEVYATHLDAPFVWLDPNPSHLLSTALTYDATLYDAVYIQLALEYDFPLLIAEHGNRGWVRKLGERAIKIS